MNKEIQLLNAIEKAPKSRQGYIYWYITDFSKEPVACGVLCFN